MMTASVATMDKATASREESPSALTFSAVPLDGPQDIGVQILDDPLVAPAVGMEAVIKKASSGITIGIGEE